MTTQDTREALIAWARKEFGVSNGTQAWVEFQGSAEGLADAILAANILEPAAPSPRVVNTVEELEALDPDTPILTAVNTCHLAGTLLAKFQGMGHVTSAMFPVTVLTPAPQVVTAEQVAIAAGYPSTTIAQFQHPENVRGALVEAFRAANIPVVE